jgi:K+-sensing histidine kinase KdpD
MGLAIAHGLVSAQHGHIAAANHPDGGALFTMDVRAEVKRAAAIESEAV